MLDRIDEAMLAEEEITDERLARSADGRAQSPKRTAAAGTVRSGGFPASGDLLPLERRTFWLAQLAFWGSFGAVTYLTFLGQLAPDQRLPVALLKLVIRPTLGLAVSMVLLLGYRRWLEGRRRPAWLAGAAIASACTGLAVVWFVSAAVIFRPFSPFPGPVDWTTLPGAILEYVFVLLAWSAAYFWIRSRHDARRKERQALRAEAAARAAQLEVLAYQLSPHFLFNALTSLRGLIQDDPTRAEAVVGHLAAFLRRTLARPALSTGALSDELAHVKAYLEVERSRHGANLRVDIDVRPPAENARIPAFLLHPLVENAVKHGRPPAGEPRRVEIRAGLEDARLRVEVANPGSLGRGRREASSPASTGVGLRNVRRRLAHYGPGRHGLHLTEEDGWVRAFLEVDQAALEGPEEREEPRDGVRKEATHA